MKAHPLWRLASLLPLFLGSCAFTAFHRAPHQAVFMEFIGRDSPGISMSNTHVGTEALKKAAAALPEV
jgi:hypothetical protein